MHIIWHLASLNTLQDSNLEIMWMTRQLSEGPEERVKVTEGWRRWGKCLFPLIILKPFFQNRGKPFSWCLKTELWNSTVEKNWYSRGRLSIICARYPYPRRPGSVVLQHPSLYKALWTGSRHSTLPGEGSMATSWMTRTSEMTDPCIINNVLTFQKGSLLCRKKGNITSS